MQLYAIPVVGAMIFNGKGQLFLMKSSGKFGEEWIIPGGKVNFGEGMEAALRREIKEETNIDLSEVKFLGVRAMINGQRHFIFLEYSGFTTETYNVILNDEAVEFRWFSPSALASVRIANPTQALLDERVDISDGQFRIK
jgi:ADP-ribose pyrophosphatase YjhB (NUDIX family)